MSPRTLTTSIARGTSHSLSWSQTKLEKFFLTWSRHWWKNRKRILTLALINTLITLCSEIVSREGLSVIIGNSQIGFFNGDYGLLQTINHQSLINLGSTLVVSLLAAPALFFKRVTSRALFFIIFAGFVSLVVQPAVAMLQGYAVLFSLKRFFFDICYAALLKYPIFELFRPRIAFAKWGFARLFLERGKQDLLTTVVKTLLLFFVGLKGWE